MFGLWLTGPLADAIFNSSFGVYQETISHTGDISLFNRMVSLSWQLPVHAIDA